MEQHLAQRAQNTALIPRRRPYSQKFIRLVLPKSDDDESNAQNKPFGNFLIGDDILLEDKDKEREHISDSSCHQEHVEFNMPYLQSQGSSIRVERLKRARVDCIAQAAERAMNQIHKAKAYRQINQKHKHIVAQKIAAAIEKLINRRNNGQMPILTVEGPPRTGKKSIIFDCLAHARLKYSQKCILPLYFDQIPRIKIKEVFTKKKCTKVFVIHHSESLKAKQRAVLKKTIEAQQSAFIIIVRVLHDAYALPSESSITFGRNSVDYFKESLMFALQKQSLQIENNLLAFATTKLNESNRLGLDYLNILREHLLQFRAEPESAIEIFFKKYSQRKIELNRLILHQKCILIGMYNSLRSQQGISLEEKQIYSQYHWICRSLALAIKGRKEFAQMLQNMRDYRFIDSKAKHQEVILRLSLQNIEDQFQNEPLFHRFFIQ